MKAKTDPINEDLYARLSKHFAEPDWWLVFEVGLYHSAETGGDGKRRSADAVAISTWSSRGHEIQGIEVKASRADWLAELREPAKADANARICRKWWVLAPEGVVKTEELPDGWGLLEPSGPGLRETVKAKPRDGLIEPSRHWWVTVLRQLGNGETIRQRLMAARAQGERAGRQESTYRIERERDHAMKRLQEWEESVERFSKASGIHIPPWAWEGEEIGRAVKVVLEYRDLVRAVENMTEAVRRSLEDAEKAVAEARARVPLPGLE